MQQRHFQQMWCWDVHVTIRKLMYMTIIYVAPWLIVGNSEILHCSGVFACRHQLFKPERVFKQTRVNILPRKYYVISQLRHSYAKDPFCVAWLIYVLINILSDVISLLSTSIHTKLIRYHVMLQLFIDMHIYRH